MRLKRIKSAYITTEQMKERKKQFQLITGHRQMIKSNNNGNQEY